MIRSKMDIHSIKSDLIAMEMELNYHDGDDGDLFDFEDIALRKTPKTRHSSRGVESETSQVRLIDCEPNKQEVTRTKYVSLAVLNSSKSVQFQQDSFVTMNQNVKSNDNIKLSKLETINVSKDNNNIDKMIAFPSLDTFKGCNSIFLIDDNDDEFGFLVNSKVNVTIKISATRSLEFSLPGNIVVERENAMKQVDMHFDWKGSLIMQEIHKKTLNTRHAYDRKEVSIVLVLPQNRDLTSIVWSNALKKSIENFYKDGVISVFNRSCARDLLLLLKFLAIQYSDKHLSFESFSSYLNFKLWSDYLIFREHIATWIKTSLLNQHSQYRYLYVTHPEVVENASFYVQGQICEHLNVGLNITKNNTVRKSCTVIHDLFAGDREKQLSSFHDDDIHPIREDFRLYLQHDVLPGTTVCFSLKTVTLQLQTSSTVRMNHSMVRPVLSIDVDKDSNKLLFDKMNNEVTSSSTQISLLNRLDVSSLTELSGRTGEDADKAGYRTERRLHQTVDSMNAEWLFGVFLCKSPAGSCSFDGYGL